MIALQIVTLEDLGLDFRPNGTFDEVHLYVRFPTALRLCGSLANSVLPLHSHSSIPWKRT